MLSRINALRMADRTSIRKMYEENGLKLSINERCPDCWKDALIELAVHLGIQVGGKKYKFVGLEPTFWMPNRIVMDASTPEAVIEQFIQEYPNQKIYETNL